MGVVWWLAVIWWLLTVLMGAVVGALTLAIGLVVLVAVPLLVTVGFAAMAVTLLRRALRATRVRPR